MVTSGPGESGGRPGWWDRLVARMQGEIPAGELDAYRRAGGVVYELLDELEADRLEWKVKGLDAWTVSESTQVSLVCAWNAFALQLLGDQLLTADEEAEPRTTGFVPPVTAEQCLAFYSPVPGWLARARQARASTSYTLDVAVPAPLPPWADVEPCPLPHLAAMRAALDQLRRHTSAAMASFHINLDTDDRRRAHDRVHEVLAEADSAGAYADRLWAPGVNREVHEAIEQHAKRAVEAYYLAGQLLARPMLALTPAASPRVGASARLPVPGEKDFDPWRLTDPASRAQWQRDRQARTAIELLWDRDPDPSATMAIQAEIEAALERGDITRTDIGPYYCCPWPSIYEVRRSVTIDRRKLAPLEQFTFEVSAEEMAEGGPFVRRILTGQFRPTDDVDYCIPGRGHDD